MVFAWLTVISGKAGIKVKQVKPHTLGSNLLAKVLPGTVTSKSQTDGCSPTTKSSSSTDSI